MIHTELTRQLNSTTRDRKQINLYFSIEAVENYKNIDCLGGAYLIVLTSDNQIDREQN